MSPVETLLLGVHIAAASIWVGGTILLGVVVGAFPSAAQRTEADERRLTALARSSAYVLWPALGLTLLTGAGNFEAVYGSDPAGWLATPSGPYLAAKFGVVAIMTATAAAHSFWAGPKVRRRRAEGAPMQELARWSRINGVLGAVTAVTGVVTLVLAAFVASA